MICIIATDPMQLAEKVQKEIEMGWVVHGEPVFLKHLGKIYQYTQLMVRL